MKQLEQQVPCSPVEGWVKHDVRHGESSDIWQKLTLIWQR